MASASSSRRSARPRCLPSRSRNYFDGSVLGLSTLAVMVAMSDTNGGMFLALTSVMGDKEDSGTYVVQSIETGPFLTMLIFVGAGLAVIPWLTMVSVIAPILAGAVLGNLDDDIKEFFGSHEPIIVPFMAFTLGQTINSDPSSPPACRASCSASQSSSSRASSASWPTSCWAERGIAGAAASSTAGNSAAVPQAVAHGRQDVHAGRRSGDSAGCRIGHRHRDSDAAAHHVVVQAGT